MLAFGVSAIGKAGGAFSQNQRELDRYYAALDRGELPVMRGWELSADDVLRNAVIQSLMCHFVLDFSAIEARFGIRFVDYFAVELDELRELAAAGLLELTGQGLTVTVSGRMLVRIIAMVFDRYLQANRQTTRYSKVI